MSLTFDNSRLHNEYLTPSHDEWRNQLRRFFENEIIPFADEWDECCLLYTSPSPRDAESSRMPSSA